MNAHVFFKGEQAYTRLFGLWPSGQGGTCYILAQIKRNIKKGFLLIDLPKLMQWVNIACICFLKGKHPYTRFLITMAFQSGGGDTKSDFSMTKG